MVGAPQISSWVNYGTNSSNSAAQVSVVSRQMTFITGSWIQAYRGLSETSSSPSQHSGTFLSLPSILYLLSRLSSQGKPSANMFPHYIFLMSKSFSFSVFLFKIEALVLKNNPLSLGPGTFYHSISLVLKCISFI